MDNTFASVLTGADCWGPHKVKETVAERAKTLLPTLKQEHPEGYDACYDGNRCKPENLGWRFRQSWGDHKLEDILSGKCDAEITATYHDAASAEHYYRYEKDWS